MGAVQEDTTGDEASACDLGEARRPARRSATMIPHRSISCGEAYPTAQSWTQD